jgi:hypothetical protein
MMLQHIFVPTYDLCISLMTEDKCLEKNQQFKAVLSNTVSTSYII